MNTKNRDSVPEPLNPEVVRHMAELSRLELTDAETEKFGRQLASILSYMSVLDKVDTNGVEPLYACVFQKEDVRKDTAVNRRSRQEILTNAPETDGECFIVPRII